MLAIGEIQGSAQAALQRRFTALWEQHQRMVYEELYRLYFDRADAAERTQDVALKFWRNIPRLLERERRGEQVKWEGYLFRAARNIYLDEYRWRRKPIKWDAWEPLMDATHGNEYLEVARFKAFSAAVCEPALNPAVILEQREHVASVIEAVQEVLALLPPHYRAVLELAERADCKLAPIADEWGISRSAAKGLVYRARICFRELWEQQARIPTSNTHALVQEVEYAA